MRPNHYAIPLDEQKTAVALQTAERRKDYRCDVCGRRVRLRGGRRVQLHWLHLTDTHSSTHEHESPLHAAARQAIRQGMLAAQDASQPYPFLWSCPICDANTSHNLLKHQVTVHEEPSWQGIRPDLLVCKANPTQTPLFAIEIVVTHSLEESTRQVYAAHRLPVLLVQPRWRHLDTLTYGLEHVAVTVLNLSCPSSHHPRGEPSACRRCGARMGLVKVAVWDDCPCPTCGQPMPVLRVWQCDNEDNTLTPLPQRAWGYTLIRKIAPELGVFLRGVRDDTLRASSRQHCCPHCGRRLRACQLFGGTNLTWWTRAGPPARRAFYWVCVPCYQWYPYHSTRL
jgi:hypothetical protein